MEREYITKIECQFKLGLPEVVRCKDCKHYSEPTDENGIGECLIKAGYFPVSADWYCADGERK